jgi:hypothetical protein
MGRYSEKPRFAFQRDENMFNAIYKDKNEIHNVKLTSTL